MSRQSRGCGQSRSDHEIPHEQNTRAAVRWTTADARGRGPGQSVPAEELSCARDKQAKTRPRTDVQPHVTSRTATMRGRPGGRLSVPVGTPLGQRLDQELGPSSGGVVADDDARAGSAAPYSVRHAPENTGCGEFLGASAVLPSPLCRGLVISAGAPENPLHPDVSFVAGVLEHGCLCPGHRNRRGPGACPGRRIGGCELVA